MTLTTFPCTKCGACCRRAHLIGGFLYADYKKGGCIMLVNNICNIYKDRPPICSIDNVRKILYSTENQTTYYKETALLCNKMIKEDNMDKKYFVNLKQFEELNYAST